MLAIDKLLDDPVGALSAHGLAGIWGTLAVGIFASPRLIVEGAGPGIWYGDLRRRVAQHGVRPAGGAGPGGRLHLRRRVRDLDRHVRAHQGDDRAAGLRAEEEEAGLDISSHGMYGYPEQFIPQPEYSTGLPGTMGGGAAVPAAAPAQMTATESD